MNDANISQLDTALQDTVTIFSIDGTEVFCPMCEIWHENNSMCQASMDGGESW